MKTVSYYEFSDGYELFYIGESNESFLNWFLSLINVHGIVIYSSTNYNCNIILESEFNEV